jgi:hypothetical protein
MFDHLRLSAQRMFGAAGHPDAPIDLEAGLAPGGAVRHAPPVDTLQQTLVGQGNALAERPRSPQACETLRAFHADLQPAQRPAFEALCRKLDSTYDCWRSKVDNGSCLEAFDQEVASRITSLSDCGYTAEALDRLESKAKRLDEWADKVVGGAKSTPFAIASVLTDLLPVLSGGNLVTDPFIKGYIAGTFSAIVDTAGGEALNRAVHDAWWLHVNPGDQTPHLNYNPETERAEVHHHPGEMSPAMQNALANLDADIGLARKVLQAGVSFQSYTVRNVGRTAISPIASLVTSEATVSHIDTGVTAIGGILAGAGAYRGLGHYAHQNGLAGLSALLSRRDYLDRLEQLEATSLAQQTKGALVRAAKVPADVLTDGTNALQAVLRFENLLAEFGPLAGGIASIVLAKTEASAMATHQHFSLAGRLAFTQLAGTLTMVPVLATWPGTSMIANHYKKPLANFIHRLSHHHEPAGVGGSGAAEFGAGLNAGAPQSSDPPRMSRDSVRAPSPGEPRTRLGGSLPASLREEG